MTNPDVIVIGGGIAGLSAAALLSYEGVSVLLIESHYQLGGCAGTFRRGSYIFDVGATQVAGLEPGGIHERLFRYMGSPVPAAKILDPACLVDLSDGSPPIKIWHQQNKWKEERERQFPQSEKFWSICSAIHKSNWAFAQKDPILPPRSFWDFKEFFKALDLSNIATGLLSKSSVADLLQITGCHKDIRLKQFLDLQLKLYSQEPAERTAALYGATVLNMAQSPLGLWHLDGSMQRLSDYLENIFISNGGKLLLGHKVIALKPGINQYRWEIDVETKSSVLKTFKSSNVICSLPPQNLNYLLNDELFNIKQYKKYLMTLPNPSGAIVLYAAIKRNALPASYSSHIQVKTNCLDSLFISISSENDGRAPIGEATLIASAFTDVNIWSDLESDQYFQKKDHYLSMILQEIEKSLNISSESWLHFELATPKTFAFWTGRSRGVVGGLGQHPNIFGPFGLSSRTPIEGLWLCGDSIYPGEGTAGVSQSSLIVCRQLLAQKGINLQIPL